MSALPNNNNHTSQDNQVSIRFGLALAFTAAFLFSTKPILIKWMYAEGMTALPLLGLRMLLVLPVYLVIGTVLWRRMEQKPSLSDILKTMLIGLLGYYLASYLDLAGLEYVSAQLERLILYAYPSMVVILGALLFKQPISKAIIPALILTYAGLFIMYGLDIQAVPVGSDGGNITLGTLLILGSALSFSFYLLLSKQAIGKLGSLFFTCVSMASASLASLVHYIAVEGTSLPTMTPPLWVGTIGLAVFATVIPTFMVNEAIKHIGPARASISGTLGPILTTLMAVVFLSEPFGWLTLLGMGLVIVGVSRLQKK